MESRTKDFRLTKFPIIIRRLGTMAFNKNDKADGAKVRRGGAVRRRKKVCVF